MSVLVCQYTFIVLMFYILTFYMYLSLSCPPFLFFLSRLSLSLSLCVTPAILMSYCLSFRVGSRCPDSVSSSSSMLWSWAVAWIGGGPTRSHRLAPHPGSLRYSTQCSVAQSTLSLCGLARRNATWCSLAQRNATV